MFTAFPSIHAMHAAHLPAPEDFPDHRFPFANVLKQALPLGLTPFSAGFPSPAEDYADRRLDINEYWVHNPVSTFFFQVQGTAMGSLSWAELVRCVGYARRRYRPFRSYS